MQNIINNSSKIEVCKIKFDNDHKSRNIIAIICAGKKIKKFAFAIKTYFEMNIFKGFIFFFVEF